jgi:pimeloyl-ACP methyl ester carboxylesterase
VSAVESAPANAINRLLAGPFGAFILKPWYDPVALQGIVRFFMPASRAWAAANTADGDAAAFLAALGKARSVGAGLSRAISETAALKNTYNAAETAWEKAAIDSDVPAAHLVALEDRRMSCADAWMRARTAFVPSHLLNSFQAVKFAIEPESSVEQRHGARLSDPVQQFPGAGDTAGIVASVPCDIHGRRLSWVRFPAGPGSSQPHGWARIEQPHDGQVKGAVIFCHGIMMEREHWSSLYDQAEVFLEPEGGRLAVISPEGPGHGRRMQPGFYGGETILAHGVGGIADYFAAHVVEVGRLIAWARKTYGGPVAVAGVSLGALTAQLVVSAAKHWPKECRPDGALLLTTNESLIDVTYNGSLAGELGFPAALAEAGWTPERIERFRPLVEPGASAVPPERIVCVLGTTDTVTPYGGGERLVGRWNIPPANVFRWPGGHFAAAFSVLRDRAPIHRFKAGLAEAAS